MAPVRLEFRDELWSRRAQHLVARCVTSSFQEMGNEGGGLVRLPKAAA